VLSGPARDETIELVVERTRDYHLAVLRAAVNFNWLPPERSAALSPASSARPTAAASRSVSGACESMNLGEDAAVLPSALCRTRVDPALLGAHAAFSD
jgi:hypothetical protein